MTENASSRGVGVSARVLSCAATETSCVTNTNPRAEPIGMPRLQLLIVDLIRGYFGIRLLTISVPNEGVSSTRRSVSPTLCASAGGHNDPVARRLQALVRRQIRT